MASRSLRLTAALALALLLPQQIQTAPAPTLPERLAAPVRQVPLWMAAGGGCSGVCPDGRPFHLNDCSAAADPCGGGSGGGAAKPAAPVYDPTRSFFIAPASVKGEFYIQKRNGRRLTADQLRTVPVEFGDQIVVGPTGRVQLLLPDETLFTLGPNSSMTIDAFVFDPAQSGFKQLDVKLLHGDFRFVTGKVSTRAADRNVKLKLAVGTIGVRGTDVELNAQPDGSGFVKL